MKKKAIEAKPRLLGSYKPECNPDGTYKTTQCHESFCFCVKKDTGEKLLGSELRFRKPKNCDPTPCRLKSHDVLSKPKGFVGALLYKCDESGLYRPLQCHGSTGYCFCVNPETGEKIDGTSLRFKEPKCESPCNQERREVLSHSLLGAHAPKCTADGSYNSTQCHEGFCYCVRPETGEEILGTRLAVRGVFPKTCKLTPCFEQRHNYLKAPKMFGAKKLECNEDGSFKSIQCVENYCYCAFPETGKEVLGTSVEGGKPKSCKLTPCVLGRHNGWKMAKIGMLGVPVSRCDPFGDYDKVQCWKTLCWCADPKTGKSTGVSTSWGTPDC